MPPHHAFPLVEWLKTSGGSRDANINGSVTAVEFEYVSPEDTTVVTHMHVYLEDLGSIDATKYGNMAAALTNGILVQVIYADGSPTLDLTGGFPVKTTGEWLALGEQSEHHIHGQGPEAVLSRQKYNSGIELKTGDIFRVTVRDNLTDLTAHYFRIDGELT